MHRWIDRPYLFVFPAIGAVAATVLALSIVNHDDCRPFHMVALIFLSGWWSPLSWVPVLGTLIDKLLDLVLAFFVYKALSREAQRYLGVKSARAL